MNLHAGLPPKLQSHIASFLLGMSSPNQHVQTSKVTLSVLSGSQASKLLVDNLN